MKITRQVLNAFNKKQVIDIVRTRDRVFKAEIARELGLSIPTVMKISDGFIQKGLIRECGKGESTGGKPPQLLEFVPGARCSVGVDIGKTTTTILLMDLQANIIVKQSVPTGDVRDPNLFLERVMKLIEEVIDAAKLPPGRLLGIGVGAAGLIDSENGEVLFSPDFGWENIRVAEILSKRFSMKVMLENSTRAKAMGEKWFGAAAEADDFICLNLGYGIAAALMIDGELYCGHSGTSGEFGHVTMERDGPECDCGNRGCLEALASGNAVAKSMQRVLREGGESSALSYAERPEIEAVDAKAVYSAAKAGDRAAAEIVEKALEYIGIGLAGIVNLFDPELVVLSGGIVKNGRMVRETITRYMNKHRMKHAGRHVRIVESVLGDGGTAIGAATLLVKRLVENGGEWE